MEEETGIEIKETDINGFLDNDYPAEIERKDGSKRMFSMKVFVCDKCSGELIKSEKAEPAWVDIDKIKELNLLPNIEKIINDTLERRHEGELKKHFKELR